MEYLTVLGIDTSDASMSVDIYLPKMDKKIVWGYDEDSNDVFFKTIPLYTLQELLDKIPKNIRIDKYNCTFNIEYINEWHVRYTDFDYDIVAYRNLSLIDAVYDILIWCILNNFVVK